MLIGLKDLFCAKVTETENGDEYGTPERMAKAMTAELSVNVAEANTYADDAVDISMKTFVDGELKLGINDLSPTMAQKLLACKMDDDGVLYSSDEDDPPYYAIGFRAKRADKTYRYLWLYKVKFAIPSESYQTKGESIEIKSPEITGKIIKRPDGLWKADYTGDPSSETARNWFKSVREMTVATGDAEE